MNRLSPALLRLVLAGLVALGGLAVALLPARANSAPPNATIAGACNPNGGWVWREDVPLPEAIAATAEARLREAGIEARVDASGFGEQYGCEGPTLMAIDYRVEPARAAADPQVTAGLVRSALAGLARPSLGWVTVAFPDGATVRLRPERPPSAPASERAAPAAGTYGRKVYVVVYDPLLSNGKLLSEHLNWYEHEAITADTVNFFLGASNSQMQYTVVETTVRTDGWPVKSDGFRYTEAEYLAVMAGTQSPHSPDEVDYNAIVNDPQLDICGKANRGEIDEVWIYNGPYFGFYESRLVGPGGYYYNSPPVGEPNDCERLIPLMGPSPERGSDLAIHNFGHRTESAMTKTYGSWEQNRTAHNWDRFALVKYQSPSYNYSGCGSIHYPPNGVSDYDYGNHATVNSNCADFENYPALGDPNVTAQPVTCSSWACDHLQFLNYWFAHFPQGNGCGSDRISADWWRYFANPADALDPTAGCPYPPDVSLAGRVARSDGSPMPGATVSITGPASRSTSTGYDGRYAFASLPPGTYTVSASMSGYTQPPSQQATVPPPKYDVNFVLTVQQLTIMSLAFSPTTIYAGEMVEVEAIVENTGDEAAQTQGPPPGFIYQEGDTFTSRGYPEEAGKWRLGVNWGPSFPYGSYWFRWGMGRTLQPGESATVTGYMRLTTAQTQDYWGGLVREGRGWYQEGAGRTTITVLPCALANSPAPVVAIDRLDSATLRLSWPAVANATRYEVYRSDSAYAFPDTPHATRTVLYFDDAVLGNPASNYFYHVKAGAGDCHGLPSRTVGKFEYGLIRP